MMKIVYLSGIDGCGKTTQSRKLLDELRGAGMDAGYMWLRWEPSCRYILSKLRNLKKRSLVPEINDNVEVENAGESEWLKFKRNVMGNSLIKNLWISYACFDYFLAYRRQFREVQNEVIILDRYVDDFMIDQAINFNVPPEEMNLMKNNFFLEKFHFPDYKIIIDLPAWEGYNRKSDGTPLSYLETREKYYLAMTGPDTLHLNGLESVDELASQIRNWLFNKLVGDAS